MSKEFLWVEKYRPNKVEDCILPDTTRKVFQGFVEQGELPNLLLSGTAGVGKTTIAKAMCDEIGASYIVINGSDEGRSIDTVRTYIKNFASTVSLSNTGPKVVIIDEADYMNPESVQPALRNFIESFSKNCRFIFTCNYKNKIIPAIQSRCVVVNYQIKKEDSEAIYKAIVFFLNNEKEVHKYIKLGQERLKKYDLENAVNKFMSIPVFSKNK